MLTPKIRVLFSLLVAIPGLAFGASDDAPPKPTNTTKSCKGVQVWDPATQKCVAPDNASLDSDALYDAARELAYAGRYGDAQGVLSAMRDQSDDRVLTYWGFTHRKMGNTDLANVFYARAIERNPDNILARSYMGQGLVEEGRTDEAIAQWREITARAGTGSWAEVSLRDAIRTGMTYNY
ncbi:tetratricopeptide repeat protein [Sedimentitalea sp. XS_ASV28]|uniref:tetratricopeptide repeat protein n=1 Tax=Sedimentitalea sp. XS_ASV28 TaxID=3241296 RepID=UPI0035152DFB